MLLRSTALDGSSIPSGDFIEEHNQVTRLETSHFLAD